MSKEDNIPPRITPRLKAAPKIRQFYWCDFPEDAQLPEFWKRRPVIIISHKNTLHGTVTVVPCTTLPPKEEHTFSKKWAFPLSITMDGRENWAICDKPSSVAVSRLSVHRGNIQTMSNDEFNNMLSLLHEWLPQPR